MERALLAALARKGNRGVTFARLFREVAGSARVRPLGLGDLQVARCALDLAGKDGWPLRIEGGRGKVRSLESFGQWRLFPAR